MSTGDDGEYEVIVGRDRSGVTGVGMWVRGMGGGPSKSWLSKEGGESRMGKLLKGGRGGKVGGFGRGRILRLRFGQGRFRFLPGVGGQSGNSWRFVGVFSGKAMWRRAWRGVIGESERARSAAKSNAGGGEGCFGDGFVFSLEGLVLFSLG